MYSEDAISVQFDSIRVWDIVPSTAQLEGIVGTSILPTPIALYTDAETLLLERLEEIAAAIPDEAQIGGNFWTVFGDDASSFISTNEYFGTYGVQSILLENEVGDFVSVMIIETAQEKTAVAFADAFAQGITNSFTTDLLAGFPEPHFAGLGAYDSFYNLMTIRKSSYWSLPYGCATIW
jgi:hypothetical protein